MRYSSIVSIMALGLASFSVAAPVGSNPPNGNGDTPGEGGPFDGFTGGLTGALGKGGIPGLPAGLGGDSSGSGSGSGSSSKRDVHASPEGQGQSESEKPKGGLLGLGVGPLVRRDDAPAEGQGQAGSEKPKGGLLGLGVGPLVRRDDAPAEGQGQAGSEKPKGGLLGLGVGPLARRDEAPAKEPTDGHALEGLPGSEVIGAVVPGLGGPSGQA